MFKNYKNEGIISNIKDQRNIMVFIGNGFDISVLKKYRNDGLVSSYNKFYDFLCYKDVNKSNVLYKKIGDDKLQGKENWSDFEYALEELLRTNIPVQELEKALKEIQKMFLLFLNEIVTPEVLLRLNEDAVKNQWGKNVLSSFLSDLDQNDYEKIKFPEATNHYCMYNYLFINFNYTSLFDDYIFLDKWQFDPHPYKYVDTNYSFLPNPNGFHKNGSNEETKWSSFIMFDIIHPHGYQSIPRSLLFGIESENKDKEVKNFTKSYWIQSNQKYKSYFNKADLFIIYGSSIGVTDSWWWRQIYNSLLEGRGELIIYYYCDKSIEKEMVKQMFINACGIGDTNEKQELVKDKIYVVLYNENTSKRMFTLKEIVH